MTDAFFNYFRGADPYVVSHFLAKFFGLYFIIVGIFVLVKHTHLKKAIKELKSSASLEMTWSFLPIIGGLLVVLGHNVWISDWPVIITILGWLLLLLGLARLFFPVAVFHYGMNVLNGPFGYVLGTIWVVLGLILSWLGFLYH